MAPRDTPERIGERVLWPLYATISALEPRAAAPCPGNFTPFDHPTSARQPIADKFRRCRTRQNLTDASLLQIQRNLARAWHLVLTQRVAEAQAAIDRIEQELDDVSAAAAKRLRTATALLRAAHLALQGESLAALAIASHHLTAEVSSKSNHIAATLCRLGLWQLGEFDAFHALPRHHPRGRWSRSQGISAMLDLSIEAAVALDHLNVTTAKRLAGDALALAEAAKLTDGLKALPACLIAQVLYEEGCLDEAGDLLRDHLPAIAAEGSIECATRAYLILAHIARYRMQHSLAALLLHEAEALGRRRQWPRLIAAAASEKVSLLLETGRMKEARLSADELDRHADLQRCSGIKCAQYLALARWRVAWADGPSREAVAALRQLYHGLVDRHDLYGACRLAIELADMLLSIGETAEADELFFQTIRSGAAAGLYQIFLEHRAAAGILLQRAYERAGASATEQPYLPFVGSLLSRWKARRAGHAQVTSVGAVGNTLTARERDVLARIGEGLPNKRIARALDISPETVKSHIKNIFQKLSVSDRADAIYRGKSLGLV